MATYARKEIVRDDEVGVYHCMSRCVRRAYLCGEDPVSGRSFDHRKQWIRDRLEELAGIFGIDIGGYAVMSNHLHVVLRIRPDIVARWSDEEVARRWWRLFPRRRDKDLSAAEPQRHELAMLRADGVALAERRRRLGSLSWLMRCLCEPIARRANKEDECSGRFWEGRFKSQALLDEAAVLACNIYVELNPVRAGVSDRPEASEYTSAYERIHASGARKNSKRKSPQPKKRRPRNRRRAATAPDGDGWLCPIEAERASRKADGRKKSGGGRRSQTATSRERRASTDSFLPMSLDDYLQLVDWTGRQIRRDKRGAIPSELAPILDRLQVDAGSWLDSVTNFGRWFHRAAGRADSLLEEAARSGRRWFQGLARCREAFR